MHINLPHPIVPVEDARDGQAAAFDYKFLWRQDAAAEQHQRRLAVRNGFKSEDNARPVPPENKGALKFNAPNNG